MKNVKHNFDLSGMKAGDWFLGCIPCNVQYPATGLAKPICKNCLGEMRVYTVTEDDL